MISIVVYGRNDQHGYNAHRRVALSLNAMAEVLTEPSDEIIFVDYNSGRGMPTLVEAIEDTLTKRALEKLRTLKVTAEVHHDVIGDRSIHPISEPHARNAAIRRAIPGNWILSTNTDMVFVPSGGRSLTEAVRDLEGDAYGLPRFEIPEWLWESVPRHEPSTMIELLREWGDRIGLNEVTVAHDWLLYDAPGDFQLMRRAMVEEIHGFDERMIHGWHVDSNIWRRVHNRLGSIGSLYPALAGYHTNHNRTATRWVSSQSTGNDLTEFVYGVEHTSLPDQASSWGLVDVELPEIRLARTNPMARLRAAAARPKGMEAAPPLVSSSVEQRVVLDYDARHVLPFLLDSIFTTDGLSRIGYVGINGSTRDILASALTELGAGVRVLVGEEACTQAEVVILDLGLDRSVPRGPLQRDEADSLTRQLAYADRLLGTRTPSPDVLLINGMSGIWTEWVQERFDVLYGTHHTRVQTARPRAEREATSTPESARRMLDFLTRTPAETELRDIAPGIAGLDMKWQEAIPGLDTGWEAVDRDGALVAGERSIFRFSTRADQVGLKHVSVELTSWSATQESPAESPTIRVAIDDVVLLDDVVRPHDRQMAFHAEASITEEPNHQLRIGVCCAGGVKYEPARHGGLQPWLRLDGLRLLDSEWRRANGLERSGEPLVEMGRDSAGQSLLEGWWARSDPDGVWAVAGGGAIVVPDGLAQHEVALRVLGHPVRADQAFHIIATGAETITSDPIRVGCQHPEIVIAAMPAPDSRGNVRLSFHPSAPSGPGGEIVQVWGVGPATRAYETGQPLMMEVGSPDIIALRQGWHPPEVGGTWMCRREAAISINAPQRLTQGSRITVQGGVLDPRRQTLRVTVNGIEAKVRRRRHGRLLVVLPMTVEAGTNMSLCFHVDELVRPEETAGAPDDRELGARVTSLVIGTGP